MTVETSPASRSYQIAYEYRRRGVKVIMGGYHPTFLPLEALSFADAVVVGDAEGVWEQVVEDTKNGRQQNSRSSPADAASERPAVISQCASIRVTNRNENCS